MKVLYVLSKDDKFGAPRALMELVESLKANHKIEPVILTPFKNKINEQCDKLGIENYHIPYGTAMKIKGKFASNILRWVLYKYGDIVSVIRIKKLIDFNKIDIIHTNNSVIDFGYKLSKRYNKKHIFHIREFADLDFNYYPFKKNYNDYLNDSYNIAISNVIKSHWSKKGIKNLNLVYDGIDLETIKDKTTYGNNKKLKFIFIGSLCESKGQMNFIEAVSNLDKKVLDNIEIHFIGSGEDKYVNDIKSFIENNDLKKYIYLDGYDSNIRDHIKEYDIGIINSKSEAFGRVTAEYMATGLCVLASNTGANVELIDDNKTGILFKYKDEKDICKKIEYISSNKNIIKEIGTKARIEVLSKYSKETNSKNVYELYKKIEGE